MSKGEQRRELHGRVVLTGLMGHPGREDLQIWDWLGWKYGGGGGGKMYDRLYTVLSVRTFSIGLRGS